MFCPVCKAEYRQGFTECSDCQTPLVDELPPPPETYPDMNLVTVFETEDPGLLTIATALLDEAGIDYLDLSSGVQDFYGAGSHGMLRALAGPAGLQVAENQESRARDILQSLYEIPESSVGANEPDPSDEA